MLICEYINILGGGVAFVSITTDPPASYYFCVLPLELNLTPHREDGTSQQTYFLFLWCLQGLKSHPHYAI